LPHQPGACGCGEQVVAIAASNDGLTREQAAAIDCRATSVVLASGAGCGKTHVLTKRYLSHLVTNEANVNQLVAITFTDRAARQMRERIRTAILAKLDAAQTDAEASHWEAHLLDLETAQISTIHAFCAALLRQHALEAELDPGFEVLKDYLAANLETVALDDCLRKLLTSQSQAGEDLRQLVLIYGWAPTVSGVRHLLRDGDTETWTAWLKKPTKEIADKWLDYTWQELLPRYVDYLTVASPGIASCLWLLSNTPCVGPKMRANVDLILTNLPQLGSAEDLPSAVEELTEAAKVGSERAKAWPSEEIYQTIKATMERFRKELPERLSFFHEQPEDLEAAIEVGQRFVRVAAEAIRAYDQLKERYGVLDFQDLLVRARDLLRADSGVRERLQRRFQYVLIDELQDTDPVQMELVELLTGQGLTLGKLFAVGDHSQSIYRFRGADVALFQNLRRGMAPEGQLNLTCNFRSQPAILDFANALVGGHFDGAAARLRQTGLEDYVPLTAHRPQLNRGPCVEFYWSTRPDGENAATVRAAEADAIARRIAAMGRDREPLVAENGALRPVQMQDVVLLFRAMTNVALYEEALRKYGLDYYLVGGRAFFAQQEIYDVLNLLRTLENPQDELSLAGTLRSPFCCLSDEALYLLCRRGNGLWANLHSSEARGQLSVEDCQRAERAARNLDDWRGAKDRLPIARLLNLIFAGSGYDAALQFEFLGDRKLANLWKLVDMAREFDQARSFDHSGLLGLAGFIAQLGDSVTSQPREEQAATQPEKADVVRLMTIHQAKGLEFPVVFIPDMAARVGGPHLPVAHWDNELGCMVRPPDEDPPPFTNFGWQLWKAKEATADWREDLRTLYVACTRAQDYLVLSASLDANFQPTGLWMQLIAERFDLQTGECKVRGIAPEHTPNVQVIEPATMSLAPLAPAANQQICPRFAIPTNAQTRMRTEQYAQEPIAQWEPENESDLTEWVKSLT
jgi:ATP-dependent helicase/nuclease subunit A